MDGKKPEKFSLVVAKFLMLILTVAFCGVALYLGYLAPGPNEGNKAIAIFFGGMAAFFAYLGLEFGPDIFKY